MTDIRKVIDAARIRSEQRRLAKDSTDAEMHKANANTMERMFAVVEAAQMFLNTEDGDGFRAKEQWELEDALAAFIRYTLDQTEQNHD